MKDPLNIVDVAVVGEVVVPAEAAENPRRLGQWLLDLTDEEFAALIGTTRLDDIVSEVLSGFMAQASPSESIPAEGDAFLCNLNDRIRALR